MMSPSLLGVLLLFISVFSVHGQVRGPGGSGAGAGSGIDWAQLYAMTSGAGRGATGPGTGSGAVGAGTGGAAFGGSSGFSQLAALGAASGGGSSALTTMALLNLLNQGGGQGNMMQNMYLINQYGLDNFVDYRLCQQLIPRPLRRSHYGRMMCMRSLL